MFGLRYLYLVPSTLFGTGYHAGDKQMHFIFDLIRNEHAWAESMVIDDLEQEEGPQPGPPGIRGA